MEPSSKNHGSSCVSSYIHDHQTDVLLHSFSFSFFHQRFLIFLPAMYLFKWTNCYFIGHDLTNQGVMSVFYTNSMNQQKLVGRRSVNVRNPI